MGTNEAKSVPVAEQLATAKGAIEESRRIIESELATIQGHEAKRGEALLAHDDRAADKFGAEIAAAKCREDRERERLALLEESVSRLETLALDEKRTRRIALAELARSRGEELLLKEYPKVAGRLAEILSQLLAIETFITKVREETGAVIPSLEMARRWVEVVEERIEEREVPDPNVPPRRIAARDGQTAAYGGSIVATEYTMMKEKVIIPRREIERLPSRTIFDACVVPAARAGANLWDDDWRHPARVKAIENAETIASSLAK